MKIFQIIKQFFCCIFGHFWDVTHTNKWMVSTREVCSRCKIIREWVGGINGQWKSEPWEIQPVIFIGDTYERMLKDISEQIAKEMEIPKELLKGENETTIKRSSSTRGI